MTRRLCVRCAWSTHSVSYLPVFCQRLHKSFRIQIWGHKNSGLYPEMDGGIWRADERGFDAGRSAEPAWSKETVLVCQTKKRPPKRPSHYIGSPKPKKQPGSSIFWSALVLDPAREIRKKVFIDEQGFQEEYDETDEAAVHFSSQYQFFPCRYVWQSLSKIKRLQNSTTSSISNFKFLLILSIPISVVWILSIWSIKSWSLIGRPSF
mgnify:CR=1 FL=1